MNAGTYLLNHDYNDPTIGTNEEGFVHVSDALEDYARVEKIEMLERLIDDLDGKMNTDIHGHAATGLYEAVEFLEEELSKLKA
jgi:hypothetical protein